MKIRSEDSAKTCIDAGVAATGDTSRDPRLGKISTRAKRAVIGPQNEAHLPAFVVKGPKPTYAVLTAVICIHTTTADRRATGGLRNCI